MRVFHQAGELTAHLSQSAVAIGNFDGIHLGHQKLLRALVDQSRQRGLASVVFTFYPHPVEVLRPGTTLERLTTTSEKKALLESAGVDYVLVQPFDAALAAVEAEVFFDRFLVQALKAQSIYVGFNFTFGHARKGNISRLTSLCEKAGISLHVEPSFELRGERVSSTLIRTRLREGDVETAARLLGRPYLLAGPILHGDNRGAQLGFPTANLRCPADKLLPKNGVYVTRAIWQKQAFLSVTNVGVRPTFASAAASKTVEAHLIDFSANLYDEFLQLEFLKHLRDEMKFSSREALISQIQKDIISAQEISWKNITS